MRTGLMPIRRGTGGAGGGGPRGCHSPRHLPVPARAPASSEEGPRTWARSGPASTGALPPPGRR